MQPSQGSDGLQAEDGLFYFVVIVYGFDRKQLIQIPPAGAIGKIRTLATMILTFGV